MSDFMLSQVQGLLTRVLDDLEKLSRTTTAQTVTLLGAVDDLAANLFATQAILCVLLRDHPVDAKAVKKWITDQTGDAANTPKALELVDLLLSKK